MSVWFVDGLTGHFSGCDSGCFTFHSGNCGSLSLSLSLKCGVWSKGTVVSQERAYHRCHVSSSTEVSGRGKVSGEAHSGRDGSAQALSQAEV